MIASVSISGSILLGVDIGDNESGVGGSVSTYCSTESNLC
jgi:hypothetical protein